MCAGRIKTVENFQTQNQNETQSQGNASGWLNSKPFKTVLTKTQGVALIHIK